MYKGILLDIDNTLYNYEQCHQKSIQTVSAYVKKELNIDCFDQYYISARKSIHTALAETASSHNRLLYFQKACEDLNINPMVWALQFYTLYWEVFLDSIELYDGVMDFFEVVSQKMKICFITDLTAHIQYRKIEKLGLSKYVSLIVTSEEAGREKPHPYLFLLALYKLNLDPNEVCMIGDSYMKDIVGASSLGIKSIWFNSENRHESYNKILITEVKTFQTILELL